ncbi:MAG TPA: lysophospholipase [Stellaceae bacterium]|nr:lysophospholipase [Stellaceae bacterium]
MSGRALKRLTALAFALALAGCASADPPAMIATGTVTPHLTDTDYVAIDGAQLPLKSWLPEGKPKAVILAVHGINDYSNAFAIPGKIWADDGIATYAFDQRGFGAAPERGRWVGTYQLDADVSTMSRLLRAKYPGVPLYLLGESMGGAVAITAETGWAGAARPDVDGLILVAPAVWGEQTMNVFYRTALWFADHVMPGVTFTGQSLHILPSDNIPMLRAFSRDPLVIKETRVDTIKGLVQIMSEALAAAPKLKVRTLLLYGAHDELVPITPVKEFVGTLPKTAGGEDTIAYYNAGYHMLLRDLDGATVADDVESWMFHPSAPLPSGADIMAAKTLLPKPTTMSARLGPEARAN